MGGVGESTLEWTLGRGRRGGAMVHDARARPAGAMGSRSDRLGGAAVATRAALEQASEPPTVHKYSRSCSGAASRRGGSPEGFPLISENQ